ncbi:MAG: tetratricopeptide repeat protein, partial [Chthoniobacterales bacterium]
AYLRALELIKRQPFEDVRKGRDFLRQAVALDPSYAQAWAQIAIAESQLYYGVEHTETCKARAREAAETAVRLQPELGEARAALGVYYYVCLQDYDRALVELQEALKNSPNESTLLFYIGLVKRRQGRLNESIEWLRKAAISDPRNQDIWGNLGRSYRGKRDFPAAREMFDRAFVLSPDEAEFMGDKAETYIAEGNLKAAEKVVRDPKVEGKNGTLSEVVTLLTFRRQFEEALAAASQGMAAAGDRTPFAIAEDNLWLGVLHYFAGHQVEARSIIEQAQRELLALKAAGDTNPRVADAILMAAAALGDAAGVEKRAAALLAATEHDVWRLPESKENVAIAYAILGDADHAIPVIEDCLGAVYRRSLTPALLRLDPVWDKIRDDPRFQKLATARK